MKSDDPQEIGPAVYTRSIADLRRLSDAQLERQHDSLGPSVRHELTCRLCPVQLNTDLHRNESS